MEFGSKFVYLGNEEDDEEEVYCLEKDDLVLSDSDSCSDDDGETCLLDILDTAGQEEYSSLRDQYVRTGDGFCIIYSITDVKSFSEAEAIHSWLKRVKGEQPVAILIANKQDLDSEAVVTNDQGEALATKLGVKFFQTSAKLGQGINDAMIGLVRDIARSGNDYKIVMLGSGAVGKSSCTLRFVTDSFVDDYDPTIEDSYRKMIKVKGIKAMTKEEKKAAKKGKKIKKKSARASKISSDVRIQSAGGNHIQAYDRQALNRPKSRGLFDSIKAAFRASSSRNQAPPPPPPQCLGQSQQTAQQQTVNKKKIKTTKTDGNVVLIPLRDLANEPNLVTGDPIICKDCKAVLTSTSTIVTNGETSTWTCEFCGHLNSDLNISEDEIPKGESIDFMLAPATKDSSQNEAMEAGAPEKKVTPGTIVYCMDISSSMQMTCEMPESQAAWREERNFGAGEYIRVSRLDCIKRAVTRLTEQLKLEEPEKKVLLTVFGSTVEVKAGGTGVNPSFNDMANKTMPELLHMGLNMANTYPLVPIEQSHESMDAAVKALRTTGCTALGPALTICTGYVSKTPCSEVVLCTDGEPNVGVGSLSSRGDGADFYRQIGTYAREKNITINILAMEGASVGLQAVSQAAELSGGTTNKLNPAEIVRQLRLIAQNEVIANSVTVTFFLHPTFKFDEPDFGDNLSRLEKEVGAVRKETDLSFRFKLRDSKSTSVENVPFQVQIVYTRNSDGMKCMRVLSKSSEATRDRQRMEENINVAVMGVAAMKTTANLAKAGEGKQAQQHLKNVKRLVKRGAKSSQQLEEKLAFSAEAEDWDCELFDNNLCYAAPNSLGDFGTAMVQQASGMNLMRQSAVPSKMDAILSRKMNVATRDAYYGYTDD